MNNVFLPQTWLSESIVLEEENKEVTAPEIAAEPLTPSQQNELHELIGLSKSIPFSKSVVASVFSNDAQASHLFAVSPQEEQVINHPGSSITIGRSGSGKTSCMLLKILGIQNHFQLNPSPLLPPRSRRQLFVTQSPVLAGRVRKAFESLSRTQALNEINKEELRHMVEAGPEDEGDMALDVDQGQADRRGLPSRWSELEDSHFPLFISYGTLLDLLEADLGIQRDHRGRGGGRRQQRRLSKLKSGAIIDPFEEQSAASSSSSEGWMMEVDGETFSALFWPSFDERLRKGIDSSLAWSEILGVVKGNAEVAATEKGYLDESTYLQLSDRVAPAFASTRSQLYALAKSYFLRLGELGMHDVADRTFAILQAFKDQPSKLKECSIAFLAVDEAQDLLLLDYTLLRTMLSNPLGLTAVGDTAQTIHSGSSFRFESLTSSWWVEEESLAKQQGRSPEHPAVFHLAINYRSHQGITRCSHAIVEALIELYPNAIDQLPRETGRVDGPAPLWIDASARQQEGQEFNVFKAPGSSEQIEFGAKTCIIVRDEAARDRLRPKVGDAALVLTLFQSKGLEFDSTLLYNLVSDSPATSSQWRALLNVAAPWGTNFPRFDPQAHAILRLELQRTYVALTRGRKNVWILEEDSFKSSALKTEGLFAEPASLFANAAKLCSGARARTLHRQAGQCWSLDGRFAHAAVEFEAATEHEEAAKCYRRGGDFRNAVRICKMEGGKVQESTAEMIVEVAKVEFTRTSHFEDAVKLFSSDAEYSEFLKSEGLTFASRDYYEKTGNYREAALVALNENRDYPDAALLFDRAGLGAEAGQARIAALWERLPLGAGDLDIGTRQQSIELVRYLPPSSVTLFRELMEDTLDPSALFKLANETNDKESLALRLASLDAGIAATTNLRQQSLDTICVYVKAVMSYAEIMHRLLLASSLNAEDSETRRLFGFAPFARSGDEESTTVDYHLLPSSPLLSHAYGVESLDAFGLAEAARAFVVDRLATILLNAHEDLFQLPTIRPPCLEWTTIGTCSRVSCPFLHEKNGRASLLQQLPVLASLARLQSLLEILWNAGARGYAHGDALRLKRQWVERLEEAVLEWGGGGDLYELRDMMDTVDFKQIERSLASASVERLWELSNTRAKYFPSAFSLSTVIAQDVAASALFGAAPRLPLSQAGYASTLARDGTTPVPLLLLRGLFDMSRPTITPESFGRTIEFFETVLYRRLPFELNPLLRCLEDLAMLALLGARSSIKKTATNLTAGWNGLIAPRPVIKALLRKHRHHQSLSGSVYVLASIVDLLLNTIDSLCEREGFLVHGTSVIRLGNFIRHVAIKKCLELLALIGLNLEGSAMAATIRTQIIEGIKQGAADTLRHHHRIYTILSQAPTYSILETAFISSANFPEEQLLALVLPGQLPTLPKNMGRIRSTRKESLEAHYLSLSPSSASLSAEAKAFAPASGNGAEQEEQQPEAEEDDSIEKQQAARTIQSWLQRRVIKRRSTSRFDAGRSFAEMKAEVEKLGSKATFKRSVLLLGPLVHLYHALQEVQRLLRTRKTALNQSLTSVDHIQLDLVMKDLRQSREITKDLSPLLKIVSPSTTPLANTDKPLANLLDSFRTKVLTALDTLQTRLEDHLSTADSSGLSAELQRHLELGKKGLRAPVVSVNGGAQVGKNQKLSLKLEDETKVGVEDAEGEDDEAAEERGRRIA
ncbi:hypothetical protein BCR35DRAFT_336316 [Leucosporidium creatinivorum]|uniref:C3H1-type domain-containing protein n=1 Tax=Leucosporidium creatinivorum TaxID=106004 RepID=A0A1Y2CB40_9BASI|nr:hypothetical protein BCR35DRAFT_336316 [Leucosporidium creatinivorum]